MQASAVQRHRGARTSSLLGLLPVPATAVVLIVVIAAVVPQLGPAPGAGLRVVPIYVAFAVLAPLLGWLVARMFGLEAVAGRAVAFQLQHPKLTSRPASCTLGAGRNTYPTGRHRHATNGGAPQ